jgi:hypothetical protein
MKDLLYYFRNLKIVKLYMSTKFYIWCSKFIDSVSSRKNFSKMGDIDKRKKFFKRILLNNCFIVLMNSFVVIINMCRLHLNTPSGCFTFSISFLNMFIVIVYSYIIIETIRGYRDVKILKAAEDLNLL